MPTDTLGAAGRSRCADPIGRARHPAECREAPGKSVEKPSRKRSLPTVSTGYANEESDSRRKRHIQGDNETHIETIRHADPERRPNRPDNLRLPVDSSGTHIAGTPAGSVSAEEVRQRAKRPSVPRKPTHDRPDVVPAFPAGRRCGFGKRFPGPFLACYRFLAYL